MFQGDLSGGEQAVNRASELGGAECAASERRALESLRRLHEEGQRAMDAADYRRVVFCMDRCLDYSPSCSKLVHPSSFFLNFCVFVKSKFGAHSVLLQGKNLYGTMPFLR